MAKYILNTDQHGNQFTIEGIHCGENGIRSFDFLLMENGDPIELPENSIATLYAELSDGTTLFEPCDLKNSTVIYKLRGGKNAPSITSLPGKVKCEIRVTTIDGELLITPKFAIKVKDPMENDDAISAEPSFSALTEALGRVLSVESGLPKKADKVSGTKGNTVVIDDVGNLTDAGMKPSRVYVVPYFSPGSITETQKEEISGIVTEIAADKGEYALFMKVSSRVIPASFVTDRYNRIRATFHGTDSITYEISVSKSGDVTTSEEPVYVTEYDHELIEGSLGKPAAAAVMAAYVQDYVAQHGNSVSDEVIAEAIEAYLKENPITVTESDPTVPEWAKAEKKPTYTASEVGALPDDTKIPTKVSELTNDKGYLTGFSETDPTVPSWAKQATKPIYSKNEVGLGNVDNVKQYSASNPPPYPVTSVNGQTGAVNISVPDVSGKANKSDAETWTFTLKSGSTVTKKVVLA